MSNEAKNWLAWNNHDGLGKECESLLKTSTASEIEERFGRRLQFGTAGLRGAMGPGFNRMNHVTVMHASQGFADYLLHAFGEEQCAKRGVVIGHDGRHYSRSFAHAAAAVFLSKNFKVLLFGKVTPTPFNPFSIKKYNLVGGAQVTASHNPKNDNGFKVYASNGAQIIPPMDEDISNLIKGNENPWSADVLKYWDQSTSLLKDLPALLSAGKVEDKYDEVFESYLTTITADLKATAKTDSKPLRVVYTAMHGVGYPVVEALLTSKFDVPKTDFVSVPEQQWPDPEFPTVSFPNPEEKGALDLAMATADKHNASLVIANDPDADRFACAERQRDGSWTVFKGDELGIIFGVDAFKRGVANGIKPEKMLFICSAVSSRMLQKMAEVEGAHFSDTMTGFKWIMNKAIDRQNQEGLIPIFCYEEALGYALSMAVPDKDGMSAAAVWYQMAREIYSQNKNIADVLDEIRKKYGYYVTNNSYFLCYDKVAINDLFAEFRKKGKYCEKIGDFKVKRIRDVTTGYDNGETANKCAFPLTPSSQMITVYFENNALITLRTSGTEPKIKWYSELGGPCPKTAQNELDAVVAAVIKDVLQPHKYPLTPANKK